MKFKFNLGEKVRYRNKFARIYKKQSVEGRGIVDDFNRYLIDFDDENLSHEWIEERYLMKVN